MKWQTLLGILLLLIIAITGIQFRWETVSGNSTANSSDTTLKNPDIEIEHPVMEHFDEAGSLAWQMEGTELQYFEGADQTLIQNPIAIVQSRDKNAQKGKANDSVDYSKRQADNPWHLKARTATITNQHTQIALRENASVSNTDVEVQSEQLQFDTTRQFATTDKAVTILARGSTTHAVGLEADLTNKILRLPGQVKETHEPNKRP